MSAKLVTLHPPDFEETLAGFTERVRRGEFRAIACVGVRCDRGNSGAVTLYMDAPKGAHLELVGATDVLHHAMRKRFMRG